MDEQTLTSKKYIFPPCGFEWVAKSQLYSNTAPSLEHPSSALVLGSRAGSNLHLQWILRKATHPHMHTQTQIHACTYTYVPARAYLYREERWFLPMRIHTHISVFIPADAQASPRGRDAAEHPAACRGRPRWW